MKFKIFEDKMSEFSTNENSFNQQLHELLEEQQFVSKSELLDEIPESYYAKEDFSSIVEKFMDMAENSIDVENLTAECLQDIINEDSYEIVKTWELTQEIIDENRKDLLKVVLNDPQNRFLLPVLIACTNKYKDSEIADPEVKELLIKAATKTEISMSKEKFLDLIVDWLILIIVFVDESITDFEGEMLARYFLLKEFLFYEEEEYAENNLYNKFVKLIISSNAKCSGDMMLTLALTDKMELLKIFYANGVTCSEDAIKVLKELEKTEIVTEIERIKRMSREEILAELGLDNQDDSYAETNFPSDLENAIMTDNMIQTLQLITDGITCRDDFIDDCIESNRFFMAYMLRVFGYTLQES